MEVYRTINGHVAKYVHDDGSETAIKTTPPGEVGCGGYGSIGNKYNIFISTSVGCPVSCKFCYLTVKKCPYHKLTARDVVLNVLDALTAELKERPGLRDMYTKISWMGMGDGFFDTSLVFIIAFANSTGLSGSFNSSSSSLDNFAVYST
jgi:adenine C2-methylase RlmN of 23S rRNA A2503 and tRNA A37